MELGSIVEFLNNKSILVIGATGFLAKIFVEKILRVQPEVKKLYLLLRAVDTKSAEERLHNEVIGKALFDVLREQHGANFHSFISEKLSPVPGDISCVDLGIRDSLLKDQIWNEVDTVINFAATTNFDERYDVALGINTMGALHLLNFVKKCNHAKVLVHLSTAYVCGEDGGLIKEKPFRLGTAKKSTKVTDIGMEKKLVEEKLKNLRSEHAEESAITSYMKDYGSKRARMHGWPNTYVFTKAMGEMLLVHHNRDTVPLVILRPTMVTSTYQEPFPGWIEGVRTIDGIPADMVINALIMAMVEYANRSTPSEIIYHVGSSLRNPFKFSKFQELGIRYFVQNPLIDKDGKPIKVGKVTTFSSMASFRIYMAIRYSLALKVFHLAINTVLFQKSYKDKYIALERKLKRGMRLADLYEPYVFFKGIFDDANSEKLQIAASKTCSEAHAFNFDPTSINWETYMMDAHFPGLVKHVLK
ncbi:hypothetical protein OIU85_003280 [Salix viminalis]|uniref:Fatty acyl-CoA reductase n=1 Tax=Salix viminalis TaxID=40686 RepID=A0A9Q0T0I3_SALVM|nr:hypothetical protein OIU85_003280 [Salix viminalis]